MGTYAHVLAGLQDSLAFDGVAGSDSLKALNPNGKIHPIRCPFAHAPKGKQARVAVAGQLRTHLATVSVDGGCVIEK